MEIQLTRDQRDLLIREGRAVYRDYAGQCDVMDICDPVAEIMFDHEVEWGLTEAEAIQISDYAYGVATWIMPREVW